MRDFFTWPVVVFLVLLGLIMIGKRIPSDMEDPHTAKIKACTDHYLRIMQPRNEDERNAIHSWCVRDAYGLNR